MKKLKLKLSNCYGINHLETEFDFSSKNTFVIYSPNGTMKTSLAKTFKDLANKEESKDEIFSDRKTERIILKNSTNELLPEEVLVIEPYSQTYESSRVSTLLVNKTLKDEYEKINLEINQKKENLIKELKKSSGLNKNIEEILSLDIARDEKSFFRALLRLKDEVNNGGNESLRDIKYNKIFNDKVNLFLSTKDFKDKLDKYIEIYDSLITNSTFFSKGTFDHYNASNIEKSLKNNKFFKANHSVYINQEGEKREITSDEELSEAILLEKKKIIEDEKLNQAFSEIDNAMKTKELVEFRQYLTENQYITVKLKNLELLKSDLWVAYLSSTPEKYNDLLETYIASRDKIKEITDKATIESTKWQQIINLFNERFDVPFRVKIENEDEAILGSSVPVIKFIFQDMYNDQDIKSIEKNKLIDILSRGEKRALYILNIIFEIEARREYEQKTLLIVDDIADSFDYRNKYAIIEYLKEVSTFPNFYQIILTHNFDFYRTICGRLGLKYKDNLHTIKTATETKLITMKYQKNVFKSWIDNLENNNVQQIIALIPFVRNIAEYTLGEDSKEYLLLTSLLHIKSNSKDFTILDFEKLIKTVICNNTNISLSNPNKKIIELIYETADKILLDIEEAIELEKKIVLSIAIRLKAEEFMIYKIDEPTFAEGITSNQTYKLSEKYETLFSKDYHSLKIIKKVNLMTPENIHLNSFMYEPILDMSNEHLKCLYKDVKDLFISNNSLEIKLLKESI